MKPFSLRQLLLGLTLLPVLAASTLVGLYVYSNYLDEIDTLLDQRGESSSRLLALLASPLLAGGEHDRLQLLVDNALEEPGVRAARILDQDGQPVVSAGRILQLDRNLLNSQLSRQHSPDRLRIARPVYAADATHLPADNGGREPHGWVELDYEKHHLTITSYETFLGSLATITAAALAALVLALYVHRRIDHGLRELRRGVHSLAQGRYDTHFYLEGDDGLRQLAAELNGMTAAFRRALHELHSNVEQTNADLRETMETLEIQNIELDLARREALEASRIKSEFLANTSHEVRTPLNGIIGFTNILLKSEGDARKRELLEIIRQSADSLLTIINDILDFSKLEAGKLVLDQMPVNLREVVEDALRIISPTAADKKIELVLFVDDEFPATVLGDPLRLKQVITNLVSNAVKFTDSGDVTVGIHKNTLGTTDVAFTTRVTDTGPGLTREQRARVFKPFSQGDTSTTRHFGGTGLGLAIVKRLVEQMGGEVGVDSEFGRGASFWFRLTLPVVGNSLPARPFETLRDKRIALYDKHRLTRMALRQLMESWGMRVQCCDTPRETLALHAEVDALVLGLDHDEAPTLPAAISQCSLPAVMLTPQLDGVPADEYYRCLSKPVSHTRLYDALTEVFQRHEKQAEPASSAEQPPASRCRVLAIDDNPTNLMMLSILLEELGVTLTQANSGSAALALCSEQGFDLVFVDIQMPGMDGIETAHRIRQLPLCRNSAIIALSAYLSPEDPGRLRAAGIQDFISKPISSRQLQELLQRHVSAPAPDAAAEHPVDIEQCLGLARNRPALAQELLQRLLASIPEHCRNITSSVDARDIDALKNTVHKLKGACCFIGVPALARAVADIERQLQPLRSWPDAGLEDPVAALLREMRVLERWELEHDVEVLFSG